MCKNFKGSHSGGSSFVNVNDCWLLQKLFVYQRYKFSFEKKKNKESQHVVSLPETGSDSPIGSDLDRGRDTLTYHFHTHSKPFILSNIMLSNSSKFTWTISVQQATRTVFNSPKSVCGLSMDGPLIKHRFYFVEPRM